MILLVEVMRKGFVVDDVDAMWVVPARRSIVAFLVAKVHVGGALFAFLPFDCPC